jgi:uncharacterized delta-60 repeat protein
LARSLLMALVIAVCLSLGTAVSASAAPGDLDTSYGKGGAAIADFGTFSNGAVVDYAIGSGMVVQPDGKAIVVGTGIDQFGRTSDIVTARFTTSGALDTSWGGTGRAQFDFGESETGYGAVLQPDGKLIVGGDSTAGASSTVLAARINTDGTIDSTFGTNGVARPAFGGNVFGRAIALQPNGAIVIAGYTESDAILVRLNNPQGTPDTTFDNTGLAADENIGSNTSAAAAVALATNGTIYVAGAGSHSGGPDDLYLASATSGGFNQGLSFTGPEDDAATALAISPSGTEILAGYTNVNGTYDFALEEFAGFNPVTSFGSGGSTIIDLGGSDLARAIALQPDGKIVAVGTTTAGTGSTQTSKIAVVRLLPNGQRDPAFGTNGVEVVGIAGAKLAGNAVALQSNGDILVGGTITPAGSTRRQLVVIRLHGDATGSSSSGGGGTTTGGGSTGTGTGGSGGGSSNGGVGDSKTIPVLTSLAVTPSVFDAAAGGPTVISSASSRKGTLITYTLNVAATVQIVVERSLPGRRQRVNGKLRCEVPNHSNAHAAECVRDVSVGSLTQTARAGANSFRFSGRLDGKKLPHATYTLVATPKTAIAGHAVSKTFKIKH